MVQAKDLASGYVVRISDPSGALSYGFGIVHIVGPSGVWVDFGEGRMVAFTGSLNTKGNLTTYDREMSLTGVGRSEAEAMSDYTLRLSKYLTP